MQLLKIAELKVGMRIAKPVYNKKGVLLFGTGTELTESAISNFKNMGLYAMYVLEPQEPLPLITDEEIEFERFNATATFILGEDLEGYVKGVKPQNIELLADEIQKRYGRTGRKFKFIQTLRSPYDQMYKHCVNMAIMAAAISKHMDFKPNEQHYLIVAALLSDIGKLYAAPEILNKEGKLTPEELRSVREAQMKGYDLVRNDYTLPAGIRRYIAQMADKLQDKMDSVGSSYGDDEREQRKMLEGSKILDVSSMFDLLTAMRIYKAPMSLFSALMFFEDRNSEYDEGIVGCIVKSIDVLPVGACVELSNGAKGLVVGESEYYALRPRVLSFADNQVYDLSQRKVYEQLKIVDIMRTMDNRPIIKNVL